jgi:hypothetical protein
MPDSIARIKPTMIQKSIPVGVIAESCVAMGNSRWYE